MIKPILTCTNKEAVRGRVESRSAASDSGCLEWQMALDRYGYGSIRVQTPDGMRFTGAHRAAWLALVGDISDPALQIDHLCRNRKCVNIDHMELVTNAVNTARADHSAKAGRSGRKTGSPPGCQRHGRTSGRERTGKDGYSRWDCQTCATARNRAFLDKKHAERAMAA